MRSRITVVLVAVLAACHHGRVHEPGDEWLGGVHFTGNHALRAPQLLAGLALHRTLTAERAPDPYQVQLDAERLRGKYVRHGFLTAAVVPHTDRAGDRTTVTFAIAEGPRAATGVVITGVPDAMIPKLRAALPIAEGAPFDYAAYDAAKTAMLGLAREAGFAYAELVAEVRTDAEHRALVQFDFTLGPAARFGDVHLTGVSGDLADAVRARLAIVAGRPFSQSAIANTRNALYGMQRFSTVRVETRGDPNVATAVVPVEVSVVESARHEVKFGGGFGIDPASYEVRARAGYAIVGWPVPLDSVSLDLRPAYALLRNGTTYEPRIRALARFDRMDFLVPRMTGSVEAGYSYLTVEAYTSYGPIARLGISTPLGVPQVQLRAGWRIQELQFSHLDPLVDPATAMKLGLDRPERDGAYEQAVVVDLRDDPLEPHRGAYFELRLAEGTRFAGGAFTYLQISPEARGYLPLDAMTLAGRARAGTFFGDVPVTDRYYAGGAASQRGFSERQLSPTLYGTGRDVPIGGSSIVDTSVELRVPLGHLKKMGIGAVTFLDGADVTDGQIGLGHLHWAAGGGIRVFTPIGPLRFDVAWRLNRFGPMEPEPADRYAFHLSLGEAY